MVNTVLKVTWLPASGEDPSAFEGALSDLRLFYRMEGDRVAYVVSDALDAEDLQTDLTAALRHGEISVRQASDPALDPIYHQ